METTGPWQSSPPYKPSFNLFWRKDYDGNKYNGVLFDKSEIQSFKRLR